MIIEDYVTFETAKLLKEKGFDEKCRYVYNIKGEKIAAQNFMEGESFVNNDDIELVAKYNGWIVYTQGDYAFLCPTTQMAMKWLRTEHKLLIEIKVNNNTFVWEYRVSLLNGSTSCLHSNTFISYEEACDEAIKYCLKHLI